MWALREGFNKKKKKNFSFFHFVTVRLSTFPLFIFLFCGFLIFYTSIVFNPKETAENLRKYGGYIPGIRPGERTAEYIESILVISSVQKCLSVDNLITYGFYCLKLLHVSIIKILDSMLSNCLFPIFHLISKMCLFHGVFWHILYHFFFFRKITTLREILCDVVNR